MLPSLPNLVSTKNLLLASKTIRQICFSIALILLIQISSYAQPRLFQPNHTWVFVVGTLEWLDKEAFVSFPQEKRRDAELVTYFQTHNVPADHIVYLKDKMATTKEIETQLAAQLAQTKPGDTLVLYYCGHGYLDYQTNTTYFASYDATNRTKGWAIPNIFNVIERNFKGSSALLTADCCYSGALAKEAAKRKTSISYACLTSSLASESSTGNWTFTECLLDGLRGASYVDLNGDGQITLAELAEHTKDDMVFAEQQLASFFTTRDFNSSCKLADAISKADPQIGKRVEVKYQKSYYKARIIGTKNAAYKVHYFGYDESKDALVPKSDIRTAAPPLQYTVGAVVEVEWEGKWYPATILKAQSGIHLVHYTGYDEVWDEWVALARIRKLKSR